MLTALVLAATLAATAPVETVDVVHPPAAVGSVTVVVDSARIAFQPPRDYLAEMRAAFTPASRAYWGTRVALSFIEPLAGILIGLLVLFSGLAAKLRDIAAALGRSRWVQLLVVLTLFTLVTMVLSFPLAWYGDYALEHQYGLSAQSFGGWLADLLKEAAVGIVFLGVVPILALAFRVIERRPRRWWLWFAVATLPLTIASVLIQPLVVDPLFNKFTPLANRQLETRILELARRADIPARKVYQANKSEQTKTYNAYVNGFGVSQRIVLWDTILHGMDQDEILFVMGHEMGHYKLGHIWKGVVATAIGSFAFFWVIAWLARLAVRRFGHAWGFHELHDPASLPLLLTLISLVAFLSQPIVNGYSRSVETQADVYGLEITRDNDAAARAFLALGSQNKSNPDPPAWIRFALYSHPTMSERLRLAMTYHPWKEGKPNRYYHGR